ncbi:hypothetical protein RUM43_003714 [Polyplax serrata]|uniref:HpcH/HpaI aldolase/citrate lyase domain-containing protein n=1 Tax=Polyplax serrata TaxID=468196 RepID=A0AAN8PFB2_POLSC
MLGRKVLDRLLSVKAGIVLRRAVINQKLLTRNCAVRRALLYVPGDDENKLSKALKMKVDCIVMDCEDGVALNRKKEARELIKKFLDEGEVTKSDPEWSVRINPVIDSDLCQSDLEAVLSAKNLPASICLPKVSNVDHLQWVEKVWNELIKRPEGDRGPIKLIIYIESPTAVINLTDICKKALDISTMAPIVPVALVFGSDDMRAGLGAIPTTSRIELLYVRQKIVLVAKAFGFQAIDMVNINYKDIEQLREECKEGMKMGYTGKQVIHPHQITVTQDSFVPSRSRVHWAKTITKAFNENLAKGRGAFTIDNAMIDMPTVKQAWNILDAAKAAGKYEEDKRNECPKSIGL